MLSKMMFRRPQNDLETDGRKNSSEQNPAVPDELCVSCPACRHILFSSELYQNNSTCPKCGHLFRMNARRRIELVADEGSFAEHDSGLQSVNRLEFPDYEQKLKKAKNAQSGNRSGRLRGMYHPRLPLLSVCHGRRFYDGQYGLGGRGKDYPPVRVCPCTQSAGDWLHRFGRSQDAGGYPVTDADGQRPAALCCATVRRETCISAY